MAASAWKLCLIRCNYKPFCTHSLVQHERMMLFTRSIFGQPRELFPLEEWVESADREAAIDPALPMIDAHHHLFDVRVHDKGWPISPLMISMLFKLKPSILMKLMCKSQDERIVKTFSHLFPAGVPYMENEMLRDIENVRAQGESPIAMQERIDALPAHNVVGTVLVESGWSDPKAHTIAMKAVPEVAMAQKVADDTNNRLCTAIVGHVPLCEGATDVRSALQAMIDQSPNFRGIRNEEMAYLDGFYPLTTTSDTKAYGAKFRSGFSVLSELGLTFDTWLYSKNIPMLRDLALAFPETTIICDHVGGPVGLPPHNPETALETWKPLVKDLADRCPNVYVKLSGLGMATLGFGFQNRSTKAATSEQLADAWRPFILHCIECFGIERCMFASNFPMDKISAGYTQLFNAFKIVVDDFSPTDKKQLFHDNAVRVYRLK